MQPLLLYPFFSISLHLGNCSRIEKHPVLDYHKIILTCAFRMRILEDTSMIICPHCGNPVTPDSSSCMICGAEIPARQDDIAASSAVPAAMFRPDPMSGSSDTPAAEPATPAAEPVVSANRPIWETLPMTDDILLDEDLLLDEPVMPSVVSTSVPSFDSFAGGGGALDRPLVPFDVPPYMPPSFSPVHSNVPKSDAITREFELTDENPGLISRGAIEGAGHAEEYLNKNLDADEDKALTGYAGAILSPGDPDQPKDGGASAELLSRPIPPIATGSTVPVPAPSVLTPPVRIEPDEVSIADVPAADVPTDSDSGDVPDVLPPADAPLWMKSPADLSDIPEDLFFEDLEADLASNSKTTAFRDKPIEPDGNTIDNDTWSYNPF